MTTFDNAIDQRCGLAQDLPSWSEAIEDCLRQMYGAQEEKTRLFYGSRLRVIARWAEQNDLTIATFKVRNLREFIAQRAQDGLSSRTIRHDAIAARLFLRFCAQESYIPANPLVGYSIPKAAKAFVKCPSDDEVRELLAGAVNRWKSSSNPSVRFLSPKLRTFLSRRNYAIISGLVETACRAGEVLSLRLDDYDPAQKQISIRTAKGDRPRILPISEEWIGVVEGWLRVRPRCASPYLFITEYGDPISVGVFSRQFRGCLDFAGLSGFTMHGLRHYALNQIAKTDLQAAMHIAGHSSLTVTQGYLHAGAEHVRAAHAQAAPLSRLLVSKRSEGAKRRRLV